MTLARDQAETRVRSSCAWVPSSTRDARCRHRLSDAAMHLARRLDGSTRHCRRGSHRETALASPADRRCVDAHRHVLMPPSHARCCVHHRPSDHCRLDDSHHCGGNGNRREVMLPLFAG